MNLLPRLARPQVLLVLVAFASFVLVSAIDAEIVIANPGLAGHEMLRYTEIIGSVSRPFDATLTLTGGNARYEYHSIGSELESTYWLDPATLLSWSSESLTKAPDAWVRRTADYSNLNVKAGPDDLVITDMGSLPVVLRGFPWGKTSYAKLLYLGNTAYGSSAIAFEFQVIGREVLTSGGRKWDCWHATTGLGGPLSLVLAKTDWWFAVEGTHPLVKLAGPSAGPGSPTRTLLLQSYASGP